MEELLKLKKEQHFAFFFLQPLPSFVFFPHHKLKLEM